MSPSGSRSAPHLGDGGSQREGPNVDLTACERGLDQVRTTSFSSSATRTCQRSRPGAQLRQGLWRDAGALG
jgi:hypothetical protein